MELYNLKRSLSKAAGIAASITSGILTYIAGPANAQDTKKQAEPAPIENIVKSYESAHAESKEKNIDDQIMQLLSAAYQDLQLPETGRARISSALAKKISSTEKKKQFTILAEAYASQKQEELKAKTAYTQELQRINRMPENKDKIAAQARAEEALYLALEKAEQQMPGTQYAQDMLEAAKRGLEHAKIHKGTLLDTDFARYIKNAEELLEKSKKEQKPIQEILAYCRAAQESLAHADTVQEPGRKAEYFKEAIMLLMQAETQLPYDQFGAQIKEIQERANAAQEEAKKPADQPKPTNQPKPADQPKPDFADRGAADSTAKKDDSKTSITDFLNSTIGNRFDSIAAIRAGAITEDTGGDRETFYANIGKALETIIQREFIYGENASGNKINSHKISGMLSLQPLAVFSAGGTWDYDLQKEWESLDPEIDNNPGVKKVTTTENITNYFETTTASAWLDINHLLKNFKIKLAYFGEFAKNKTETRKITETEDFINPAGNYTEEEASETTDRQSLQGGAGLIGIMLEPIDKSIRGHIGALFKYTNETTDFAGLPKTENAQTHFGLQGEIYDSGKNFAFTLGMLQELANKDEKTGKPKLRTTSGQASAAIDIGTIDFTESQKGIRGVLFGGGWFSVYQNNTPRYGGNIGAALGSDIIDRIEPQELAGMTFLRDSRNTGLMPEINNYMRSLLSKRAFDNITLRAAGSKDYAGFAVLLNGGTGKAQGMKGKIKTEAFAEGAAILSLQDASFMLSGYYADLALERVWGVALKMYLDYFEDFSGLAAGFEFSQRKYLPTAALEREVALSLEIPLGTGKKEDKK